MSTQKGRSQTNAEILEGLGVTRETTIRELKKVAFAEIGGDSAVDAAAKVDALAAIARLTPARSRPAKTRDDD